MSHYPRPGRFRQGISIQMTGQQALLTMLKQYDAAKPEVLSKALKAGCRPLKDEIKREIASVTNGKRTKSGAVVSKTRTGWRAHAGGGSGIGQDIPIFQHIRGQAEKSLYKGVSIEAAFKSGDQKLIDVEMKKVNKALKAFEKKNLVGKAWRKFTKLNGDAMLEKGSTGMLYKSVDIKYLRPIRVAYHHQTGEEMGRTGTARSYDYTQNDWNLAKWKTENPEQKVAYVGPRHMVVIAYNPWSRTLEKVDPARYAHLVEKGHLIKVRGKTVGRVKPRPFVDTSARRMKGEIVSAMKSILRQELGRVLMEKDTSTILNTR